MYSSTMHKNMFSPVPHQDKQIAVWLLICCAAIFAMVVLGGVTRLTGSGLSMVTWDPIMGAIPPLSQIEWEETFRAYQNFPEFQYKNSGMDLAGFKNIFWFEYTHRLLGRFIGLLFFLPLIYFMLKGKISQHIKRPLIIIFTLGGLQGFMGWFMVKSGLAVDPHVSQYRLTAHLGLAFIIYSYIFWIAMGLIFPKTPYSASLPSPSIKRFSLGAAALIFFTAMSGGFVAGLKAGFIYNTFPLMGDSLVPDGVLALTPAVRNFFENAVTVQFDHRVLAITTLIIVVTLWFKARKEKNISARSRLGFNLMIAAVILQVTLGISTLLLEVPVSLGAAHQAGALLLLTAALFASHAVRHD